jgi:hypothetical protein
MATTTIHPAWPEEFITRGTDTTHVLLLTIFVITSIVVRSMSLQREIKKSKPFDSLEQEGDAQPRAYA